MKEEIYESLKQIKYPGFDRDIVSFGMVKDVNVHDNHIHVKLAIKSSDQKNLETLQNAVKSLLREKYNNFQIDISIENVQDSQNLSKPKTSHPQSGDPWANHSTLPGIKYVIAVASGKGGVGKSTIATNLAATLAKNNYQTGLLDLDVYGPSMPVILGGNIAPEVNEQKKILPLKKFGMKVMSFGYLIGKQSPVIWRGPMVAKLVNQFFNDIDWGKLDYLILDLPPGTGDVQLSLVQRVKLTGALIVTTPQELALADVKRGAEMFRQVNTPVLGIVENMSFYICKHCGKEAEIFGHGGGESESKRLNIPLLAKIPLVPDVVKTSDAGIPAVLSGSMPEFTKIFSDLADRINQMNDGKL